jgi:transaldolase / glucose-6-phosphate isomerase
MDKNAIPIRQTSRHLLSPDEEPLTGGRPGNIAAPWVVEARLTEHIASRPDTLENSPGWLNAPALMMAQVPPLEELAAEILTANFRDIVMLGEPDAALVAMVLASTFRPAAAWPRFRVLATTMPERIKTLERNLDIKRTLCVVADQSDLTVETAAQLDYFLDRVKARAATPPGKSFVAIANAGSPLEEIARREKFRRVFIDTSNARGFCSPFSYFGLVPAALLGMDVGALLERAVASMHENAGDKPVYRNSGVRLGAALAALKRAGRDKIQFVLSPPIAGLGGWLSRLIMNAGAGIVAVVDEPPIATERYGDDRAFIFIRYKDSSNAPFEPIIETIKRRGYPMIEIAIADKLDLGAEFLRWEAAVATLTLALGIKPSKEIEPADDGRAKHPARVVIGSGTSAAEPIAMEGELSLFSGEHARTALKDAGSVADAMRSFLDLAKPVGYLAISAFVAPSPAVDREFAALRHAIAARLGIATVFSYESIIKRGSFPVPHQAERGLFLQVTHDHRDVVSIPGRDYDFAALDTACQRTEFEALDKSGCRVMRIHLGGDDPIGALAKLRQLLVPALSC